MRRLFVPSAKQPWMSLARRQFLCSQTGVAKQQVPCGGVRDGAVDAGMYRVCAIFRRRPEARGVGEWVSG